MRATIRSGSYAWTAEILDTPTGRLIMEALPFKGQVNRWGEEIYFCIPVNARLEPDAREVLELGELGYWPTGKAFCIFFGPTPASRAGEIRAASAVNVFGRVTGDLSELRLVNDEDEVTVEKEQD